MVGFLTGSPEDELAVTVVSWNIARSTEPWRQLLQMDADVALLQEAAPPPDDLVRLRRATLPPAEGASPLDIGPREAWDSHSWNSDWWRGRGNALFDRWPMVVRLSDRVDVEWFKQVGDELDCSFVLPSRSGLRPPLTLHPGVAATNRWSVRFGGTAFTFFLWYGVQQALE